MYKVVFTVVDVANTMSINGNPTHVTGPYKMYQVGDKMTIVGNPGQLVLVETDSVCLAAFSSILPLTSAMTREITESWDYIDQIKYFSCPDSERPVLFKVERVEIQQKDYPPPYPKS